MEKARALELYLKAGMVRRYHTMHSIEQDVAQHSFNVAGILLWATDGKASKELLTAALYHDLEELRTGDLPYAIKRKVPGLEGVMSALGDKFREEEGLEMPTLTDDEKELLKQADAAEMALYGVHLISKGDKHQGLHIAHTVLRDMDGQEVHGGVGQLLEMVERYLIAENMLKVTHEEDGNDKVH